MSVHFTIPWAQGTESIPSGGGYIRYGELTLWRRVHTLIPGYPGMGLGVRVNPNPTLTRCTYGVILVSCRLFVCVTCFSSLQLGNTIARDIVVWCYSRRVSCVCVWPVSLIYSLGTP